MCGICRISDVCHIWLCLWHCCVFCLLDRCRVTGIYLFLLKQTAGSERCGLLLVLFMFVVHILQVSFDLSEYTANVDAVGTLRLLDAVRTCGLTDHVRFYQASTSELYGKVQEIPQKETTPFYPRSPYGLYDRSTFYIEMLITLRLIGK